MVQGFSKLFFDVPGCCGCCSALRPRYKRLVDNIFPENPEDGLVKSNMEKLTFYSLVSRVSGGFVCIMRWPKRQTFFFFVTEVT